jgi:pyruvate, water dikinase
LSAILAVSSQASSQDFYAGTCEEVSVSDAGLVSETAIFNIEDRAAFDMLASGTESDESFILPEVKFLITDIRTDCPRLYFINSNAFEYHWIFYGEGLGWYLDLYSFNSRTYTDQNRLLIAGSVIAHDRYSEIGGSSGIFTIEFWPSDPIHADDAAMACRLVNAGMAFAEGRILYHPTGQTQVRIYEEERDSFESEGVPVIFTSELFEGVDYAALNPGTACGILIDGSSSGTYSARDIVVFRTIPNDISHVAGIITTIPQTPLSHINLKAIQNHTPNVYIPGFTEAQEFRSLLGKYVRLTALPGGYSIEEISFLEAMNWLESVRPDSVTILASVLTDDRIGALEDIRLADSDIYGAKAAGLGELTRCLPSAGHPDGCAVPFSYYHIFMEYNNLYSAFDSLMALPEFGSNAELREEMLRSFRRRVRAGELPGWMMDSLSVLASCFEPGVPLRCRSSTNNEDLPGFNGAGLYSSYTHREDEGHISETIKQVWAGMWNFRAFEEREFYRIDHSSAAMGVVVHPSYRDELANGVAVTRNIFNPFVTGFYVNVQVGDDMVTNPDSQSIPEEFLITEQNLTGTPVREIQYINLSNRVRDGETVLSEEQIDRLAEYLSRIHDHFARLYGYDRDDIEFAMEIEFKITSDGVLIVKQARPWVSGG